MPAIKHYIITLAAAATTAAATSAPLTTADYCDPKSTAPAAIKEMRPTADGLSYTAASDDGKQITLHSYKTGDKTATLFSTSDVKGDLRIESFDGYKMSANEKKILLWTNSKGIYRHSFTATYYVYDIMRGTLKAVSDKGPQRCATLSHDGRMVAYVRDNNVWISNLDYGTDKAVTTDGAPRKVIYGAPDWCYEEEFGVVNTIRWSGDDVTLAFVRFDETDVPEYSFDIYSGYCNPDPQYDLYPGQYRYKYPLAGFPVSKVSAVAYNLDNETTKTMQLPLAADDYIPSFEFDHAGTSLMIMALNHDQNHLRLYSVNPGSTVARQILEETSDAWLSPGAYQTVSYEKDGFVIASDRSGWRHLYLYSYSGTLRRQITSGEYNVTAYYGSDPASGAYYFQTTQLGAINRNIARADRAGKVTMLDPRPGTQDAYFSTGCKYYVMKRSDALTPPVYTLHTASGQKVRTLEDNAAYAARYASAPKKEFTTVPNAEGKDMNAYVIYPPNFDSSRRYPVLAYQYNGPESQEVKNAWKMEGVYAIAAAGYIVTCADGRGTGAREREWATCVYKRLGTLETLDQTAAARHWASKPWADPARIGCFGWSYGGYMTLMELTAERTPLRCGVAMAPVTDWRYYDAPYTERFMLTPRQNEAGYKSASAIDRIPALQGRLLIMSGTADDNVHFYNTLKYTSRLTSEGKIFDMMALTGFDHSLRVCNARTELFRKIIDFLDTHLRGDSPTVTR